ncbi:hypothetical protein F1559_004903 [Cyanidiococcus yangmingshanensis]|uniref:Uncharacterized protein n=1 Tax=Cyanidiococcus yangmingshanensis TaxID=2690220 RepID=A0A7J7IND9_9RHOD|nr:hypothetical protein F1559_004903 [Cyanidiococcus yangmingshanensis]
MPIISLPQYLTTVSWSTPRHGTGTIALQATNNPTTYPANEILQTEGKRSPASTTLSFWSLIFCPAAFQQTGVYVFNNTEATNQTSVIALVLLRQGSHSRSERYLDALCFLFRSQKLCIDILNQST